MVYFRDKIFVGYQDITTSQSYIDVLKFTKIPPVAHSSSVITDTNVKLIFNF